MRYEEIVQAKRRLSGVVHHTPLVHSKTFSEMAGGKTLLKLENLQRTGAFKLRGAFNKVASLAESDRAYGIVTASAGNHAQGVACAAAHYGVAATVVMPQSAPAAKVNATENYGAAVVLAGANYDEAYAYARQYAEERGATFVHAFDDAAVIAGQGTIGIEIVDECPDVDTIVVPIGGGGLIAGVALAAKAANPSVRIVGVQPESANSAYLSWQTGRRLAIASPVTIADGLAVKSPGELPWAMMQRYVDDIVTVSDDEIVQAMRLHLERAKLLVEGAGAAPLAALLGGKIETTGRQTALVVSGGNVDLTRLALLAGLGDTVRA
ncbi:threonine ammonia-lyase [Paenibacillus cymbidii]|uniref:threonine ammonia-lyase n=1 Tax=Paenibacillus cymbidii TaxID=1639034 RepID=UPI0010806B47|nr:threonine ammonia-lyase [Paenibacillus cymbidii]